MLSREPSYKLTVIQHLPKAHSRHLAFKGQTVWDALTTIHPQAALLAIVLLALR